MTDMQPLPKDAPVMLAWADYQISDGYQNTRNWALKEAHVDGSLWAAFLAGFEACAAYEVMASSDGDVIDRCVAEIESYGKGLVPELRIVCTWLVGHFRDPENRAALTQSSVQPK